MNQYILQDIHQIRTIVQQVAQTERQNAQQFARQPGLQNMAQQETFSAQQLQHVVDLTNRIEQALVQTQYAFSQPSQQIYGQAQGQPQSYAPNQWSQPQVNQNALNAIMNAAQPAPGTY